MSSPFLLRGICEKASCCTSHLLLSKFLAHLFYLCVFDCDNCDIRDK